jgi:plastocyanin
MKKLIVIGLLAAVVAVSGCTQQSPSDASNATPDRQDSQPSSNPENMTRIEFTGSGFEPADVTVEAGETVVWVNEAGSATMWIGSDRHPTHTDYSGTTLNEHCQSGDQNSAAFDQCSTGDRFSFTFEKTGEWGYHNHRPYVQGGTVTVVENK